MNQISLGILMMKDIKISMKIMNYDRDRYYSDDDYAAGVDDAMDELDW